MTPDLEELRWFLLPDEVSSELRGKLHVAPAVVLHP